MKKIVNVNHYAEQLAFIPDILEPLMNAVYTDLKKQIPKGWVFLRFEEVPEQAGRWRNEIKVTTTLIAVKAPYIVTRLKLMIHKRYKR